MTIRDLLKKEIQKSVGKGINFSLSLPPRPELGDYATNVAFVLAKKQNDDPKRVAEDIVRSLREEKILRKIVKDIRTDNGFINFSLDEKFSQEVFAKALKKGLFLAKERRKEKVLVEYSSPNIGKPLSIAHIRSTIIGDALTRIYRALGYKVITDNHLGDWGLQVGILIAAVKLFSKKPAAKLTINTMQDLYVRFNHEMQEHKELEAKAKLELNDLQNNRLQSTKLWQILVKKSKTEFQKIYAILGVKFDHILGESFYRKLCPWLVEYSLRLHIAKRSEGAVVIPLEKRSLPPVIIQKQDGGYLYHTFDLATIWWRNKKLKPQKVLYVVSNEQALHFEQLFLAANKLGWIKKDQEFVHIKFGLMRGEDLKRLSTRKGKTILLEEVIKEAIRRARKIVEKKNPSLSAREKKKISRVVGIGALKYNDLSQNRNTDIVFNWGKILDFEGNSAPYLQYTYARLRSILRKIENRKLKIGIKDLALLEHPEELGLLKKVLQFQGVLEDAAKENLPNLLCNYLWELANLANTFYEKYPVLKAEADLRNSRLALIDGTSRVLKQGLLVLGIEAPERI